MVPCKTGDTPNPLGNCYNCGAQATVRMTYHNQDSRDIPFPYCGKHECRVALNAMNTELCFRR